MLGLKLVPSWLCYANVREPAMVSHQGGSASNIEVFLGNGSQSLMLGTALVPSWLGHANVREPAMVQYQGGGSESNIEALPRIGSQALMPGTE